MAAWLPASPPASPRELPPPPTGATAAPGKRGGGCARPLFSSSLLQIRVGKESARLRCSARSPEPCICCPGGWAGGRAGQSVRKRAERSEHAPQLSDARPERAAAAPPSRSLSPAGKEAGRSAGAERENLNRPSSPGAAAPLRPRSRPGVHPLEVECIPGQWVWQTHLCDYTRHGSARTHPTGARAQHRRLQTASEPGPLGKRRRLRARLVRT